MNTLKNVAILALSAIAPLLLASSIRADPASVCYEAKLSPPPHWVSSAVWLEDRAQLVVIDPKQEKLLAYGPSGQTSTPPSIEVKDQVKTGGPTVLSPVDNAGFLVELTNGTLLRLDKELRPSPERVPAPAKRGSGYRVGSFYQWKVADGFLVAYGALLDDKDQITRGFFRVPLGSATETPEMLTVLSAPSDSDYYLIGNSYIATIGDAAYYVAMGKHPTIYKVTPGHKPKALTAFPPDRKLRTRLDFTTPMTGPSSAAARFKELEGFTVVSGLYAGEDDGMLYLLTRSPGPAGAGIEWSLYKIDPSQDKLFLPPLRLPTSTKHLTVVPSKDKWFLLERGAVGPGQSQTIDKMVVVESSAISSLARLPRTCPAP